MLLALGGIVLHNNLFTGNTEAGKEKEWGIKHLILKDVRQRKRCADGGVLSGV